jgi:hypothetical protein
MVKKYTKKLPSHEINPGKYVNIIWKRIPRIKVVNDNILVDLSPVQFFNDFVLTRFCTFLF